MKHMVVIKYNNGTILKGFTQDFAPSRGRFHVVQTDGNIRQVSLRHLKAVFFVRDLEGRQGYRETKEFTEEASIGKRLNVTFLDGENIRGKSLSYNDAESGFFLEPADPNSNNIRIYVVKSSTKNVVEV